MKNIFLFLLILLSVDLTAQNWDPICDDFLTEFNSSNFPNAIEKGNQCLEKIKEQVGEKDTSYCNVLYYLEYAHYYSEGYEEAVKLARKEVEIRKEIEGESHLNYITACYNYAVFSTYTKDYQNAILYMNHVWKYYQNEFGKESEYTLQIANQYANILNLAGSFELAKKVYEDSYQIIQKNYTIADSIFQAMTNTVSNFYYTHGMFDLCEPFFTNALKYQAEAVGKESETYLLTLNNTGEFYLNAGMYAKAEKIFAEQLEVAGKFYGKKSADYATSLNNLAVTYENQDKLEEADELYQQALKLKAKIYTKESNFYALTVLNYGVLKYHMSDYEASEEYLQEAMDIYEKIMSNSSSEYITAVSQIALIWKNYGELDKAIQTLNKSIEVTKKNFGTNNLDYARLLEILGNTLLDKGDFKKSEEYFKKVLEIREKIQGNTHPDYATTLSSMARLKSSIGNNPVAENMLRTALKIRQESQGNDMIIASTYSELASVLFAQGNVSEAKKLYKNALKTVREVLGDMHPDYVVYLTNAGIFYMEIGELDEAQTLLDEALQKGKLAHGNEAFELHYIYNTIGNVYLKNGDFKSAEESFQKSLRTLKNTVGEEHPDYATTVNSLGVLYYELGNYDKAEKYYSEALPIYKKIFGKEHPQYATICNNIGSLYMKMGGEAKSPADQKMYWDQADIFLQKVLAIDSATIGTENADFAIHINNLAELNRGRGKWDLAEEYYLKTIQLEEKLYGSNSVNSMASLNNLALLYLGAEKWDQAKEQAEKAAKSFDQNFGSKALKVPRAWSTLAYIYEKQNDLEKAFELHERILTKEFHIVKDNFSFLSEEEKANYLEDFRWQRNNFFQFVSQSNFRGEKVVELAYRLSLFEKGLLLKSTQEMKRAILNSGNEELLAKYEHWQGLKQELAHLYSEPNSPKENQVELEERCNQLEKELVSATGVSENKDEANLASVLDQLKPGQVAIEFIEFQNSFYVGEHEKKYAALLIGKELKPTYVDLFPANKLEAIIGKVGMNNVTYVNEIYGTKANTEKALYNLIWAKIDSVIGNPQQVFFSPSGLLNKIAFAGIRDENGVYLSDKYEMNQLSSTANIPSAEEKELRKNWEVALFGGARYSLENTENEVWKYLKGTLREAHNIGHLLDEANFKVKERLEVEATEENLKALNGDHAPRILHVATHGFFYPDPLDLAVVTEKEVEDVNFRGGSRGHDAFVKNINPLMRSGLVLTGANNVWNQKKDTLDFEDQMNAEDGVITAFEISALNLEKTELAVLSACETGLGDIKGSEGVYGLQRAFKMAGVNALIMSLWQVPDKETEEFMTLFYKNLIAVKNIRKAFLQAQGSMQVKYDPYYWAAFILVE